MSLKSDSILTAEAESFIRGWYDSKPYVIAHTSGSTGAPKEVRLNKADMRASARATIRFFGLTETSTLLLPLSPDYIAGKMQIARAIEAGCRLVTEKPSSKPFADSDISNCSLIPIVPSQLDGLLSSPIVKSVRNIIIGGAPMSPAQEESIIRTCLNAYATYGMTETCSHVALRRIGDTTYQGLPGFKFSTDERGCLVIESSTLSFRRLVTNDMVRLKDGERFQWLGRYDNVINSGGVKIHPEEVERILTPLLPEGVTAYVTGRRSDRWGEEAVIVTDSPGLEADILDRLKSMLPPHHAPRDVVHVDAIPRTSSGKIIRKRIN